MKPVSRAALAATLGIALSALASGPRETRPVGDFTEIALSAPIDVKASIGAAPSLTLEGDAEALARIETVVESGKLKIRVRPENTTWHWNRKVKAFVVARRIEGLAIAGSGDITATGVQGEALKVSIAGSGDVRVDGKVEGLTASIAGSGDIRAEELEAQKVKVTIAGSGDATVRARQALSVNVSGSGDVRYYGDPAVEKAIRGSGSVRRAAGAST